MISRGMLLVLLLWSSGLGAAEEIQRFRSVIEVQPDGEFIVTETITVTAEGREIKRGIYRDFPTDYRDAQGRRVRVSFNVMSAKRDGQRENHRSERMGNGVRVYLGSADVFLQPGTYSYEIVYRSRGQLGFFDGYDEIYWNATGNGWIFPIREATAIVRLPEPVAEETLRIAGYTGAQGATGTDYQVSVLEPGVVEFRTTHALGPQEGLTVAVGFPKGIVTPPAKPATEPTPRQEAAAFPAGHTGGSSWRWRLSGWVGWVGVVGVFAYYFYAWRKVGRDPRAGVIIPRYHPPEGYSPAALRYVKHMKYDSTCMAAALVNLAVKGALSIHQKRWFFSRSFSLRKINASHVDFAPGERAVFNQLLGRHGTYKFSKKNYRSLQKALKAHEAKLKSEHAAKNFRLNRGWVTGGLALSGLVVVAVLLLYGNPMEPIPLLAAINGVFFFLMRAPTPQGRKILDHIDGLRLYLGVAEKQTFENMDRPRTLEEFERMLPYAVALDCASTWVDQFEDVLEALERSGELGQRNWITTTGAISASDVANSVNGLASGFSSTISSSSSPPGSTSGSGGSSGGGSSGGGGGGGGGGGW